MKLLVTVIVAILALGCNKKIIEPTKEIENNSLETLFIDIKEAERLNIDIFEFGGIIPLETNESFLIGNIARIDVIDSTIFILDDQTESIFSYYLNGKKKKKINRKGRGSKEYIFLQDYFIDGYKKIIYVPDAPRKSVLSYNLSGDFLKRIKFSDYIWHNLVVTANNNYCFFSQDAEQEWINTKLWVFDCNGKLLFKFLPHRSYMKDKISLELDNPICYFQDTIFFLRHFDNNIYAYSDTALVKRYQLHFGENMYRKKEILKSVPGVDPFFKLGLPRSVENLHITSTHIYFMAIFNNKAYECYYDKKTKKVNIAFGYSFNNTNNILPSRVIGTMGDWFIYIIMPSSFKAQVNYLKEKIKDNNFEQIENLINLNKQISINDNPLLILYKPKTTSL